jgi:uncharacterized protein YndB with AHSA1/START domain
MSTENRIIVQREIPAPAKEIFAVLTDPAHHAALDGSGFIRGVDHGDRITATGQSFRMNMSGDHMGGEYQTDNLVTGYAPSQLVAWQPAPVGTEPPGWEWLWELKAQGSDATTVTLTYDWDKVTDTDILKKVSFPLVSEAQLEETLNHLAEAVSGT